MQFLTVQSEAEGDKGDSKTSWKNLLKVRGWKEHSEKEWRPVKENKLPKRLRKRKMVDLNDFGFLAGTKAERKSRNISNTQKQDPMHKQ